VKYLTIKSVDVFLQKCEWLGLNCLYCKTRDVRQHNIAVGIIGKQTVFTVGKSCLKYIDCRLDYGFTAKVEADFDKVADGKMVWNKLIQNFYTPFHKRVDETLKENTHTNAERELGTDPASGKIIIVRLGKFGPLVQKGANDDPDKQFVSLQKGQLIESITLEEALKLFELPRKVGEWEGKEIIAAIGKFGPYIKYNGKFISLGKVYDPRSITESQAIELLAENAQKEANSIIHNFEQEDIQVLNGRFGPYIKHAGTNYKIPKGTDAKALDLNACKEIIANTKPTRKKR
jgi:DNA topoisomerase-1